MALNAKIYSQLWRCCTARGSSTKFSLVGPTKVKAHEPYLLIQVHSYIVPPKEMCYVMTPLDECLRLAS